MEKEVCICQYSHDYDGFAFVENNCICTVCYDGAEHSLLCSSSEEINLGGARESCSRQLLTPDDLALTKKALCLKYCQSEWAKICNIHNRLDAFEDETPVIELVEQSEDKSLKQP